MIGNIVAGGIVLAALAFVIVRMVKNHRKGKRGCGCGCGGCPKCG